MIFYLGTHQPHHMEKTSVPLFVSRRRLYQRRRLPQPKGPWALDSGGFTELSMYGAWSISAARYAREVGNRYKADMPGFQWASPMDWMCEPWITAKTGMTVQQHQQRTVENLVELRSLRPDIRWTPVVQGWQKEDYVGCVEMYDKAGVDLTREPLVGVGSVCRRQHTDEAAEIFCALAGLGLRLHGYGLKLRGIEKCAGWLSSCDSLAWSLTARHSDPLPGCVGHINCANCLRYALLWREKVVTSAGSHFFHWKTLTMTTEQTGPPTKMERVERDIEYVRIAQIRFREGYLARLAEPHPKKRNASGKILQQDEPKWRFCEMDGKENVDATLARERCPKCDPMRDPRFLPRLWPAHESERWVAGYLHADNLCAVFGLSHARTRDPARTPRKKRETLAEPLEAFPDAILGKEDARAYHEREDRIRHGRSATLTPTTVDR